MREDNLRAISISGAWGVGKTYLVQEFVKNHKTLLKGAGLSFAYVSLFGVQTTAELRSRLTSAVLSGSSRSRIGGAWEKIYSNLPSLGKLGPVDLSNLGELAGTLISEGILNKLFVCIDDLERAGPGLRPQDVLGEISALIEQRASKCVLVLNREKIEGSDIRLFEEKVFDLTIDYKPHVAELLPIGLARKEDREQAKVVFEAFACANIRLLRRLDWVLRELSHSSPKYSAQIWPTVVRQAAIMVILRYEHGYTRAAFEKVFARNIASKMLRDMRRDAGDESAADLPKEITGPLDDIAYEDAGFDSLIVDLLEYGSVDHDALRNAFQQRIAAEGAASRIYRARQLFADLRGPFSDSGEEFLTELRQYLKEPPAKDEGLGLTQLCEILLVLDPSSESVSLVESNLGMLVEPLPVTKRPHAFKDFPQILSSGILERIAYKPRRKDVSLSDAFRAVAASYNSWDHNGIETIARATDEELENFFLGLKDDNATTRIKWLRERIGGAMGLSETERTEVANRVEAILERIAKRSRINRLKVSDLTKPE